MPSSLVLQKQRRPLSSTLENARCSVLVSPKGHTFPCYTRALKYDSPHPPPPFPTRCDVLPCLCVTQELENAGCHFLIIIIIIINALTARVVGAPQMILQPVFSIFPCSALPSGTWPTPGLSVPRCCLPTSSSVCLVFFPLSLCLARWFWPDLMSGKHDHTSAVCVSLRSSGGLCVVQLPAGSWY